MHIRNHNAMIASHCGADPSLFKHSIASFLPVGTYSQQQTRAVLRDKMQWLVPVVFLLLLTTAHGAGQDTDGCE